MLHRIVDFADFFALSEGARDGLLKASLQFASKSEGMMDWRDYFALGAALAYFRPSNVFEIGTFKGITSSFVLMQRPDCRLVSIAYQNGTGYSDKRYNNSHLTREMIGSLVDPSVRSRFTQLIGDSHDLTASGLIKDHGRFDMVLVDGDHSYDGVALDTALASDILMDGGAICWHDANPKPKYEAVRRFLETGMPYLGIATMDTYSGGVAVWSSRIHTKMVNG